MTAYRIPFAGAATLLCLLASCERSPSSVRFVHTNQVFGTQATVTAYAADLTTARQAVTDAFAEFDTVNRLMSDYADDTEIGRFNQSVPNTPFVVSTETFRCIAAGRAIAEQSGGAFDPTCRPLVQLWKAAGRSGHLPAKEDLAATRACIGWQHLQLDPNTRAVWFDRPMMQLDLGGIAKGYALDLAAEAMQRAGAQSGLVDVGGDVRALGLKPDGTPWHVAVRNPFGERDEVIRIIELPHGAVATSGGQERFVVIDGQRYSHIVDPRTGEPTDPVPSVTVIAADGLTADAWATAFTVLGLDAGRELLAAPNAPQVEVLWILRGDDGPRLEMTPGFRDYLAR